MDALSSNVWVGGLPVTGGVVAASGRIPVVLLLTGEYSCGAKPKVKGE